MRPVSKALLSWVEKASAHEADPRVRRVDYFSRAEAVGFWRALLGWAWYSVSPEVPADGVCVHGGHRRKLRKWPAKEQRVEKHQSPRHVRAGGLRYLWRRLAAVLVGTTLSLLALELVLQSAAAVVWAVSVSVPHGTPGMAGEQVVLCLGDSFERTHEN